MSPRVSSDEEMFYSVTSSFDIIEPRFEVALVLVNFAMIYFVAGSFDIIISCDSYSLILLSSIILFY